jgi:hypothetical protein
MNNNVRVAMFSCTLWNSILLILREFVNLCILADF